MEYDEDGLNFSDQVFKRFDSDGENSTLCDRIKKYFSDMLEVAKKSINALLKNREMKMVLLGLYGGLGQILYIVLLQILLIYVYSVAGMIFFRSNDPWNFRSVEISMLVLLRVLTFDVFFFLLNFSPLFLFTIVNNIFRPGEIIFTSIIMAVTFMTEDITRIMSMKRILV